MQSRSGLNGSRILIGLVGAVVLATLALAGGITTQTFLVIEDSSKSTTWTIGSAATRADYDTSIVYDAQSWDNLTLELKFRPNATETYLDSGAATIAVQMSNDKLYWTQVDSALAVDSLVFFRNVTMQRWRWCRFVGRNATKTDSAGVNGTITANARGQW